MEWWNTSPRNSSTVFMNINTHVPSLFFPDSSFTTWVWTDWESLQKSLLATAISSYGDHLICKAVWNWDIDRVKCMVWDKEIILSHIKKYFKEFPGGLSIKGLAWSLLWLGFNPRSRNFCMPQAWPKNKNKHFKTSSSPFMCIRTKNRNNSNTLQDTTHLSLLLLESGSERMDPMKSDFHICLTFISEINKLYKYESDYYRILYHLKKKNTFSLFFTRFLRFFSNNN